MSLKLSDADWGELWQEDTNAIAQSDFSEEVCKFSGQIGRGSDRYIPLRSGLHLMMCDYELREDLTLDGQNCYTTYPSNLCVSFVVSGTVRTIHYGLTDYRGLMKRFYLESKALELITLQFCQFQENKRTARVSALLKSDDIERIHHARDILIKNFDNPPSLLELARQVAMNDHKLNYQPNAFYYLNSWRSSIAEGPTQLKLILQDSPSLKPYLTQVLADYYQDAVTEAVTETGLTERTFPQECPYSQEQVLDPMFLPRAGTSNDTAEDR